MNFFGDPGFLGVNSESVRASVPLRQCCSLSLGLLHWIWGWEQVSEEVEQEGGPGEGAVGLEQPGIVYRAEGRGRSHADSWQPGASHSHSLPLFSLQVQSS